MVHNARGWRTALGSAVIAAIAAPVIFEFPFDLIVMSRIYPGLPPDPALYRALFFAWWALAGFGYPSAPVPTVLNVVPKILAMVVALTLFVPAEADAVAPGTAARAAKPASASAWTGVM